MQAPPVKLRVELQAARDRGEPFGRAWPRAVRVALAPLPAWERKAWSPIIEDTSGCWRNAYEGRAAGKLAQVLGRLGEPEAAGERPRATLLG